MSSSPTTKVLRNCQHPYRSFPIVRNRADESATGQLYDSSRSRVLQDRKQSVSSHTKNNALPGRSIVRDEITVGSYVLLPVVEKCVWDEYEPSRSPVVSHVTLNRIH